MRILWIDHADRYDRYDDWLHWRFAKGIAKQAEVFFYAPQMSEKCPQFTPIRYERGKLLQDIINELKLDVVIVDTKASVFDNYFPATLYPDRQGNIGDCWLPKDFAEVKIPKICIEEDFHYETHDNWHRELGFKIILQKHYSQSVRKMTLPFRFFPFSVDTTIFKSDGRERELTIGFAGTTNARNQLSNGSVYQFRESAVTALHSAGLLAPKTAGGGGHIEGVGYIEYLKKYIGYISCGSVFDLTSAKMFEIMASGGILLTNKISGLDVLFDEGTHLVYNNEANNIIPQVEKIIKYPEYRDEIMRKATDCILRKHTQDIRVKELLEIINEFR